jgi:hypothetical protein
MEELLQVTAPAARQARRPARRPPAGSAAQPLTKLEGDLVRLRALRQASAAARKAHTNAQRGARAQSRPRRRNA